MPDIPLAGGTTWNLAGAVETRWPELASWTDFTTTITQIVAEVQDIMKSRLRPHWDVDDDDFFSSANVETYAPTVKRIHLIWSGGESYLAGVGKNSTGTVRSAEYGAILVDQANALLTDLIENGALIVSRRTSPFEGGGVFTTAGNSTPVFTDGDETTIPYTPSSGTRDEVPWR
jgi:hypothetical protein